jgi:DUF3102 family protein
MNTILPSFRFDYGNLPAVEISALRAQASRVRKLNKSVMSAIIEVGKDLLDAKSQLEHGQFRDWVEIECGFNIRTAENYMSAAQFAEGKNATVSLLPPAVVYKLAAKSTPASIVDQVLERAAKGEPINQVDVETAIGNAKLARHLELKKKRATAKRLATMSARKQRPQGETFEPDFLGEEDDEEDDIPPRKKEAFLIFANEALKLAKYDGEIDDEVIEAAQEAVSAWSQLLEALRAVRSAEAA